MEDRALNIASIIAAIIASYAAIVSTFSLILAMKAYHAGNPKIKVGWRYFEPSRDLTLDVLNTGRADVSVSTIDLYIQRARVTSRRRNTFGLEIDTLDQIADQLWREDPKSVKFPYRLASNSMVSLKVTDVPINLPTKFPFDELELKFVVRFPGGKEVAYLRGEPLRHFVGINPDVPITLPSPGTIALED